MPKQKLNSPLPPEPEPTKEQLEAAQEGGFINDSTGKETEKAVENYKKAITKVDNGFYGHMNPVKMGMSRSIKTSVKHIF